MKGDTPIDNLSEMGALKGAMYYAQRMVPFPSMRRLIARLAASSVNLTCGRDAREVAAQLSSEDRNYVDAIHRNGWTPLGVQMPRPQVDEMRAFLADQELVALDGRRFQANSRPDDVRLGSYPISTVLECPHVIELMNRPDILGMAAAYLGCVPTISGLRIDWSYPGNGAGYVQQFHRDYDDWRFLKLFMYLTDVDDDSGPHEYVAGSHRGFGQLRATLYDPESLRKRYGAESLVRVHGPRGTLFMVDTWGIHKGNVPVSGPRMLLQIQYSILPVLKFDYQPVDLQLAPQFSRYTNRLMIV